MTLPAQHKLATCRWTTRQHQNTTWKLEDNRGQQISHRHWVVLINVALLNSLFWQDDIGKDLVVRVGDGRRYFPFYVYYLSKYVLYSFEVIYINISLYIFLMESNNFWLMCWWIDTKKNGIKWMKMHDRPNEQQKASSASYFYTFTRLLPIYMPHIAEPVAHAVQ